MRQMTAEKGLQRDQIVDRAEILGWFRERYPLVKEGTVLAHLVRMSVNNRNRLNHTRREDGSDDLFFQLEGGRYRLYEPERDGMPIREAAEPAPKEELREETGGQEFAYEHDLRDFLARNLHLIEPGLRLYTDEGIRGIEFPAGGRFIDILAVDKENGYVVIELKVSKGYDRVVGQLLRYMAWIEKNQAEPGQRVRGVIIAKEISEDLKLACSRVGDVRLMEYALSVTVREI